MANCFIRTVKGNYYIVVKLDDGTSQSFSVRKELGLKRKATGPEAKELLRRKMNELADGGLIKSGDITVGRFMSDWLEIKKASIKEATYDSYKNAIEIHIKPSTVGKMKLKNLNELSCQRLVNDIAATGKVRTARYVHTVLHQALKKAVKWKMIPRNFADDTELPKYEAKEKQIWTDEQAAVFLSGSKKERLYPFYVLLIASGIRRGEGLGLSWDNVEFKNNTIKIKQTLSRGKKMGTPKTKKSIRAVALDDETMTVLKEHRKRQLEELMVLGVKNEHNLLFLTTKGTPYEPGNVLRDFKKLCNRLEIPVIPLHNLRHLHVSWLIRAGVDIKTIQEREGHARAQITLDTYAHLFEEAKFEAAEKAGDKIKALRKKA